MNQRNYLKTLVMPILILLLWALMLFFPLPSIADVLDGTAATDTPAMTVSFKDATSSQEIQTPELQSESVLAPVVTIQFPRIDIRGIEQSGLKSGDQFTITIQNAGVSFNNVTVDLHELGLSENMPMSKDALFNYFTSPLTLPASTTDGTKTFTIHAKDGIGNSSTLTGTVVIDAKPPKGTLKATFTKASDLSGAWTVHVSGTFDGTGSDGRVVNEYTYGVDMDGKHVDGGYTSGADTILQASSPFSLDLPIVTPDITWSAIGYGITIADQAGNLTTVESKSVPIVRPDVPLIDHAILGGVVAPKDYGNTPSGVGIPYSLINTLPLGDYYAVVFFDGINGCPSNYYSIGAFVPGHIWGVGVRPDLYQRAYRSSSGGCMQEFNIDPSKGHEWLWGALSANGSAPAIGDDKGIPAFAICATAAACDAVMPHVELVPPQPQGISNVLFLPGIEGSNLYRRNEHCDDSSGTCDVPVWLPQNNSFVPKLFLDEQGKSLNDDIYTKDGDILAQAYGKKFYASFVQGLADAQASGKFGIDWKWKAVAYDWRLSLTDIITNGVERNGRVYYEEASSTPYIEQTLRQLAATSKTGKVTIVAHSGGGLVAKALMQKLGYDDTDKLVDKVVLVGTPQSGVPEAVGALLYGDKQEIPNIKYIPGLILSTVNARTFGLHSPMAYSLLPTDNYFSDVADTLHPVVSFTANVLWSKERAAYGNAITTRDELQGFALAREGGRTMPAPTNLTVPNVLNPTLFENAVLEHIPVDLWIPPEHVRVYQIAGWGVDTVSGIDLYEQPKTRLGVLTGGYRTDHRLSFVEDGDGSVPVPSALMMFTSDHIKRYWENLRESKKGNHTYGHIDLFEIPQLQTFVQNLIAGSEELTQSIYATQPVTTDPVKKLMFTLHSVADFDVSDSEGNHTGSSGGVAQESIPNSTYGELGDMQYAIVPSGQAYTLAIQGTSSEPFTLDMEEMTGDTITASTTILDVPATDRTHAHLSITSGIADASSLAVDTDGDGTTDFSISPTTGEVVYASTTDSQTTSTSTQETEPVQTSSNGGSISSGNSSGAPILATTLALPQTTGTSTEVFSIKGAKFAKSQTNSQHVATSSSARATRAERSNPVSTSVKGGADMPTTSSTPETRNAIGQDNLMAAVPESAFLRLVDSIGTLLSKILLWLENLFKGLSL
ncbi:hypothetical protein BH11PAT2_BH11PAT2_03120 [soil metagenome]